MDLVCEERPSDSPFIAAVWRSQSEQSAPFISIASTLSGLVITKYRGKSFLTVRGPETKATPAHDFAGAEFIGVQFKPGVFMPKLPPQMIMDRRDLSLPEASGKSFWLDSSAWQYPNYETIEAFVDRLVRQGLLAQDRIVDDVIQKRPVDMSMRTVRRRFLRATGLTPGAIHQIERARYAAALLKQGMPILDAVSDAGYFDQPHLTRSLKHYIGLTPAQVMNEHRPERLSFLYKQNPTWLLYNNLRDQIPDLV